MLAGRGLGRITGAIALLLALPACGRFLPLSPPSGSSTTTVVSAPPPARPANCHLLDLSDSGLGAVRSANRVDPVGTADITVLFVDFPDEPADLTPREALERFAPATEQFLETVSYGRIDLEFRAHEVWLRMSHTSSEYADAFETDGSLRTYVGEAIDLADDIVDFSMTDAVLVVATPNADDVGGGRSRAWYGRQTYATEMFNRDGQGISNAVVIVDTLDPMVVAHEIGHTLSLADLYSYFTDGRDGYTRPFSLMDVESAAPELLAYERYVLGWLGDDQVICQNSEVTATITPIEVPGGIKAVMVPLSPSIAVVVESRRALGYDRLLDHPGAVVSLVDTSRRSGEGTIEVMNGHRALGVGESVTVAGVTVTVLAADGGGDTVFVTIG